MEMLYINDNQIFKNILIKNDKLYCGYKQINVTTFEENLPNGKIYKTSYRKDFSYQNSDKFIIPNNHYFF